MQLCDFVQDMVTVNHNHRCAHMAVKDKYFYLHFMVPRNNCKVVDYLIAEIVCVIHTSWTKISNRNNVNTVRTSIGIFTCI